MTGRRGWVARILAAAGALFILGSVGLAQQSSMPKTRLRETLEMGRGMSPITADLIPIAVRSNFFLDLAQALQITPGKRKSLENLFFQVQQANVRSEADLDVVDAELRRSLSSDTVDMGDVRAKLIRMEKIRSDGQFMRIQATLRAIAILDHDQHLRALLLATEKQPFLQPSN